MHDCSGRPWIPPEQLLPALLLMAIYGLGSERLPLEQLDDNMVCRWFVGRGRLNQALPGSGNSPPSSRQASPSHGKVISLWLPDPELGFRYEPGTTAEGEGAGPVSGDLAGGGGGQTPAEQRARLRGWRPAASLGYPMAPSKVWMLSKARSGRDAGAPSRPGQGLGTAATGAGAREKTRRTSPWTSATPWRWITG